MDVQGLKDVQKIMKQLEKQAGKSVVEVSVGYTAEYALDVHENVAMAGQGKPRRPPSKGKYWDPQGRAQAKFLEQPARENSKEYGDMIGKMFKKLGSLPQALYITGLRLQADSQKLVPVDTGALKGSAFTRLES